MTLGLLVWGLMVQNFMFCTRNRQVMTLNVILGIYWQAVSITLKKLSNSAVARMKRNLRNALFLHEI